MARPRIKDEDKKQSLHITISKEHIELLRKLGNGNASEGIRYLINKTMFYNIDKIIELSKEK